MLLMFVLISYSALVAMTNLVFPIFDTTSHFFLFLSLINDNDYTISKIINQILFRAVARCKMRPTCAIFTNCPVKHLSTSQHLHSAFTACSCFT
jgi:hypothetical protein